MNAQNFRFHVDAIHGYAESVAGGRPDVGRWVTLAGRRHIADMERADAGGRWIFDETKAIRACRFIETLPHVKGEWAQRRELIRLEPWMQFAIGSVFGWVDRETGLRRFRTAYLEVARKNAKSTLLAGVSLYCLGFDDEEGAEVYSAAASKDQAKLVFNTARAMALKTPALEMKKGVVVQTHKIVQASTNSIFEPLAAQTRTLDGLNPHCATLDELHAHKSRDVYDVIDSGMGARAQPILFIITTAGHDVGGVCFEQHRDVQRLLEGISDPAETDRLFGLIYAADEGDEPGDPNTWRKANPNMGVSVSEEYIAGQYAKAKRNPAQMGEFLRKHLCRWTSAGAAAFDLDGWAAGLDPTLTLEEFRDLDDVLVALDGSKSDDFSSLVVIGWRGDALLLWSEHWATQDVIDGPGNEHLRGWADAGWLHECPGARIDQGAFEARIDEVARAVEAKEIVFDPHYLAGVAQRLSDKGHLCVEQLQRPGDLNAGFREAIGLVRDRKVRHRGDPVMTWMISNTVAKPVNAGEWIRIAKLAPQEKIDGVQAWLTGMARLEAPEEAPAVIEIGPDYAVA